MAMILAGEETLVNTHTDASQEFQQVAALGGGGWVLTWGSSNQDGSGFGIYQQVYDASGAPLGLETLVNSFTLGDQTKPRVTALKDGGWVVTWTSSDQDGSDDGIYQQAYDAFGLAVGSETRVSTFAVGDQDRPIVAALDDGGWVVAWISDEQDGDASGVYQQAYGASGAPIGAETRVNSFTGGNQAAQQVTVLEGGGWVVTWSSSGQDGSGTGIYQQAYNSAGLVVGGETRANTFTVGNQLQQQVTALEGGGWVVTWTSAGQDGSGNGIYQQVYSANATKVGGEVQVNLFVTGNQVGNQVTSLPGGGWVVVWTSSGQDGDGLGVYSQVFTANGNRVGEETLVNTTTASDQGAPQVETLPDGGWVVVWRSLDPDTSNWSIRQQAYSADGSKAGLETQVSEYAAGSQANPKVAATDNGWVVTWESPSQDGSANGVFQKAFHFNQAPAITSNGGGANAAVMVAENTLAVTTVTSSGPEDQARTYSLAGGADAAKFQVNASTGTLSFKSAPNVEAPTDVGGNNVYDVVVQVSDGDLTDTQAIAVTVTDVNEAPTGLALSKASINENATVGAEVGRISAADQDGDTLTFAFVSNPGGFFKIAGNEVQVAKPLDFEAQKSHAITIEATDPDGLKTTKNFAITVGDVADGTAGPPKKDAPGAAPKTSTLTGTAGKDTLTGGKGIDDILGLGGKDKLFGKGASDTIHGGDGNDTLVGGGGADTLIGGKGSDTASYEDAVKKVVASLKAPHKNQGDARGDSYSSVEKLTGSSKNDKLTGDGKDNTIRGGDGYDTLAGGRGKDLLTGGGDGDLFVFKSIADSSVKAKARDVVADFSRKQDDRIDVSAIDARSGTKKNDAFAFIGGDDFSGTRGELRLEAGSKKTFVYGDVTGDGNADFAIELTGSFDLRKGDFVL